MNFFNAFRPRSLPLSKFERRISGKNSVVEEGVFDFFINALPEIPKFCVEFGAGNGTDYSLVKRLIQKGWGAFLIEASPKLFAGLSALYKNLERVKISDSLITAENIEKLFLDNGVPEDIGILCIDIDGMDYHVWNAIRAFNAALVCIEYNASFGPREKFVAEYRPDFCWGGDDYFGASFSALVELAKMKGYRLVHCSSDGDNLFFLQEKYLRKLSEALLPIALKENLEDYFQWPHYGRNGRSPSGKGHPISIKNSDGEARRTAKLRYRFFAPLRVLLKTRGRSNFWR
jgi:hypothetical protein